MSRHLHQAEGRIVEVKPHDGFNQQAAVSTLQGQVFCTLPSSFDLQAGDTMFINSHAPILAGQRLAAAEATSHEPEVGDRVAAFFRGKPARPTHAVICQP
jgi:hypothetical protein